MEYNVECPICHLKGSEMVRIHNWIKDNLNINLNISM